MIDTLQVKSIVYVDDDEDDRLFFSEALNELIPDIDLRVFENGKVFLNNLLNNFHDALKPSLIFLDLNMPIMNGFDCLIELKKHADFQKIPVIVYTTSSSAKDKRQAENLGVSKFLTKEMSFKKMVEQLGNVLNSFPMK